MQEASTQEKSDQCPIYVRMYEPLTLEDAIPDPELRERVRELYKAPAKCGHLFA